jgi:hypothetical protein
MKIADGAELMRTACRGMSRRVMDERLANAKPQLDGVAR